MHVFLLATKLVSEHEALILTLPFSKTDATALVSPVCTPQVDFAEVKTVVMVSVRSLTGIQMTK
jgi:hypothetical protein